MTVEEALVDLLARTPGPGPEAVRAHLGDRLFPLQLPQGLQTWPAATYRRVSAVRTQSHAGPSGLVAVRLQVDIYSRTALGDAVAAGEALRGALDGFRGWMGTLRVDRVLLDAERDDYDPAEARKLWRRSQDYRIWAAEL